MTDDQTPAIPPAGAENEALAQQALGDVPETPAPPAPTPEEMAAAAAQQPTETVPAVPVNDEVNATNPSNVQNAEVNEGVAQEIAETGAAIQETEQAPNVPPTGPPPPPAPPAPANPSDVPTGVSEQAAPVEPEPGTVDLGPSNATQWVCLNDAGARSGHPPFGSNSHLVGVPVTCPTCAASGLPGTTVIRQEGLPQQAP